MIDALPMLVGAAVYAAGFLTGRFGRRRSATPEASTGQVCGCGHALALHDRAAATCGAEVERPHYWANGTRNGREWVECPCRSYDGQLPAEEILGAFRLPPREDQ